MMRLSRRLAALFYTFFAMAFLAAGIAEAKRVDVIISKTSQKMTVKVDGATEYVWPVSTGAAGYETPTGDYKPFRMEAEHFSKEWDDAPMPHSIFFTMQGHAIHGSFHVKSLGRKASHGCVRLAPENAAILFSLVSDAGMSNTKIELNGGLFDFGSGVRTSAVSSDVNKAMSTKVNWASIFGGPSKPKAVTKTKSGVKVTRETVATKDAKAKKDTKPVKVSAKSDTKAKAAPAKPKKVAALKCSTVNGKKVCKKPFYLFGGPAG